MDKSDPSLIDFAAFALTVDEVTVGLPRMREIGDSRMEERGSRGEWKRREKGPLKALSLTVKSGQKSHRHSLRRSSHSIRLIHGWLAWKLAQ